VTDNSAPDRDLNIDAESDFDPDRDLPERFAGFDHAAHIERAIGLAEEARERGDDPYGSVLVREDCVVMEARNAVVTENDLAAHPELALARRAARELAPETRREVVLYTSTEPCPMCAGGLYHAGLPAVVYSVSAERAGELGTDLVVPSATVFSGGRRPVAVAGPVLPEAGERLHR
jgi:tRNA(Arg) A34 adenosine deaminase TadA